MAKIRGALLALALLAVIGVGAVKTLADREPEARFCTAGLAIRDVGGRTVQLQDQGPPGADGCDNDDVASGNPAAASLPVEVLGFDCRIRDQSGAVVETIKPNRSDGTCGQEPRG